MNIFNALFLIWTFFDKNNIKIINYLILLLVLNLVIGLWNCILYNNLIIYGRFNDVIIIEFKLYIIKCIIFLIYLLYKLISYILKKNIKNTKYSEYLITEPIN
jgi:hypothetical protein